MAQYLTYTLDSFVNQLSLLIKLNMVLDYTSKIHMNHQCQLVSQKDIPGVNWNCLTKFQ